MTERNERTQEIKITPAMIEAGALELVCFDWIESAPGEIEDRVRSIFMAMIEASHTCEAQQSEHRKRQISASPLPQAPRLDKDRG